MQGNMSKNKQKQASTSKYKQVHANATEHHSHINKPLYIFKDIHTQPTQNPQEDIYTQPPQNPHPLMVEGGQLAREAGKNKGTNFFPQSVGVIGEGQKNACEGVWEEVLAEKRSKIDISECLNWIKWIGQSMQFLPTPVTRGVKYQES